MIPPGCRPPVCRNVGWEGETASLEAKLATATISRNGMLQAMSYHLIDAVQAIGQPRVLVLGDLILDRYIWGDAERVSQEAPVILLRQQSQEDRLGGAANVANMLAGLEADVSMAGVVGADTDSHIVRETLLAEGIDCDALIVDSSRPTTVKERYLGRAQQRHPHQMLRVDREVRTPLNSEIEQQLLDNILPQLSEYDAVLISDYGKGVCTANVIRRTIEAARESQIPVIVDPSSSGNCTNYVGATAITPNRLETSRATGQEIANANDAFAAGRRLCAELQLDYVFVTLDSDGIVVVLADGSAELLPTRRREVYDITGAGDMVLATIGIGAAAGIAPSDLARLANISGGLEVEQIGVAIISRDEIIGDILRGDLLRGGRPTNEKVCEIETLSRHVEARRKIGQRIVFTNGCFDLLHPGHVQFLQEARTHGDCLIVAVNSDEGVAFHKGPQRPIVGEQHRAMMLSALECVDYSIIFHEHTPHAVLERLKPDLLVKGGSTPIVVAREIVEESGGQVLTLNLTPDISTTTIVQRIQQTQDAA
jgi:D-beta-D-heptose 7-phosphate kinase/D-beta-D-heptose 1-phosphate adenosyltransferase